MFYVKHSLYNPTLQKCCYGFGLLFRLFLLFVCLFDCFFLLKLKLLKKRETVATLTFQRLKEMAKPKSKVQLYFTTGLSSVYEVSNLL